MIRTIFFDLGNVLIDFDPNKMWHEISKVCNTSIEELKGIILENQLWKKYEIGNLETGAFVSKIQEKIPHSFDPKMFTHAASDIFTENPYMTSLLKTLFQKNYQLILISNTCDIHFEYLKKRYEIFDVFDELVLSYKVQMRKPNSEIFSYALSQTSSDPSECLFIDDLAEHTQAANQLGIHTHHFKSFHELKKDMLRLKIEV